jgi:single-strand DNA-binding protein
MNTNVFVIEGNLTRDPELKTVGAKETPVASFGVACNKRVQENGEWKDGPTSFYEVQAWTFMAERVMQLHKGTPVIVVGDLEIQQWEDKEGNKRVTPRVTARTVGRQLLKGNGSPAAKGDDDIPFMWEDKELDERRYHEARWEGSNLQMWGM